MKLCVLGAGAWGTALAIHLSKTGHDTVLVSRREEHANSLLESRMNIDYLPGIVLPESLEVTADRISAVKGADIIYIACPSRALRSLCEQLVGQMGKARAVITLCKGLEQSTLLKPAEVVKEVLGDICCGVFSGPNYAYEVAEGKPTAAVLAISNESLGSDIQKVMSNDCFRVYLSKDIVGVELGACLKNVYAIGAGISDGLGLGDNAKASFLTRALNEMVNLGVYLGGERSTFYGLSGFGDLVATCQGAWSRNRTFGESIGKGASIDSLLANRKTVVEGYWATECFNTLCKKYDLDSPILEAVYSVLYRGEVPQRAIGKLMQRTLKSE